MTMDTIPQAGPEAAQALRPSRTVIVGFDGSEESRGALRFALERTRAGDTVHVIHSYAEISSWIGDPFYSQELGRVHDGARRLLGLAEEIARDAPAEVTLELHEGAAAEVLTRMAALRGADEIVVGTRGLGRIRAALGSVAQELVRTSDRPVLVVPVGPPRAA
jgi:nucleotide-binding universal stress UspA family protein